MCGNNIRVQGKKKEEGEACLSLLESPNLIYLWLKKKGIKVSKRLTPEGFMYPPPLNEWGQLP